MTKQQKDVMVLIPLGGVGQRFSDVGHSVPKPLIKALGQPILYWLLRSLTANLESDNNTTNNMRVVKIVIPYHPDLARFRFEDQLRKDFPHWPFHFCPLPGSTQGAADTLRIALESLHQTAAEDDTIFQQDLPIISLDGDNFYTSDIVALWKGRNAVITFPDYGTNPIYSYVQTTPLTDKGNDNDNDNDDDKAETVVQIKEKVKISNLACTGAYGFASWRQLLHYAKLTLADKANLQKNEFYISSIIALMVASDECHVVAPVVPREHFVCLGTPMQLRACCNDFPRRDVHGKVVVPPRRFCFDLDNTLVTFPRVPGDYTTCEPIQYMVEFLRYLKGFDHTIIIYTARRMATHKGNASAALADIGKITFDTLDKYSIPYDEIVFGKPQADVYFDDLAVSAYADVEKALGFYRSHVKPRVFNDVSTASSLNLMRKTARSGNLKGEIHFYNHIPLSVKDCFPIMVNYDDKGAFYDVEKVSGTTVSNLLISHELSPAILKTILSTLHRLHKATDYHEEFSDSAIDIYANYASKVHRRYDQYQDLYAEFEGSAQVYHKLIAWCQEYQNEGRGICCVVHGDPVFSNILVNSFGKIKLIDMRGMLGDTPTIRGDELYDWAKVYQSLIGYDEILQSRSTVTDRHRQSLLSCFWETLAELAPSIRPADVKLATQSLLFSLLPLHSADNEREKQNSYFDLITRCD